MLGVDYSLVIRVGLKMINEDDIQTKAEAYSEVHWGHDLMPASDSDLVAGNLCRMRTTAAVAAVERTHPLGAGVERRRRQRRAKAVSKRLLSCILSVY